MAGPPFILPPGEPAEITAAECFGTAEGMTAAFVGAWSSIPPGMTLGTFVQGRATKLTGTPTTVGAYSLGGGLMESWGDIPTRAPDVAVTVGVPAPPPFLPAPLGMRLLDRITILAIGGATVITEAAAHVGSATVGMELPDGYNRWIASEELRALMAPYAVSHLNHYVRWRGDSYLIEGPPVVYRRGGRDHHLTLKLKRPDAV